eukprot:CAMPEP_0198691336 /NCGR_PEP_ID=MMETSP1468-20131203/201359_1 /TAXON_ID=1461545 /ORGANISM="Mantoniella sp, Strain CCMP1436" /LENGTH=65 /DNA_ID=CAMNT_0044444449 /DNA_START=243 /DNA_END=436 /DNA_ORIENTATION=-
MIGMATGKEEGGSVVRDPVLATRRGKRATGPSSSAREPPENSAGRAFSRPSVCTSRRLSHGLSVA